MEALSIHELTLFFSQASARSGNVVGMGKGFRWPVEMQAKDLGEIIEQACRRLVGRLVRIIRTARADPTGSNSTFDLTPF